MATFRNAPIAFTIIVSALLVFGDWPLRAQEAGPWSETLQHKPALSDTDVLKKREDSYWLPIPLVAFDPDFGFGSGARLYYYINGKRTHPLFRYTPYFHRLFVQIFLTTKGLQNTTFDWDAPYVAGSLFRIRTKVVLERDPTANYFGVDSDSLRELRIPEALHRPRQQIGFSNFEDYNNTLRKRQSNGSTFARYNDYILQKSSWQLNVERDVWGGVVKGVAGIRLEKVDVDDYTGKKVETSSSKRGIMGKTLLREDQDAGRILGFRGGLNNVFKLGILYDTRDFEPDPNRGIFADLAMEFSNDAVGSDFEYTRTTTALRGYYSPFPNRTDLVLVARGTYSFHTGDVPFFALPVLGFTHGPVEGLGGATPYGASNKTVLWATWPPC